MVNLMNDIDALRRNWKIIAKAISIVVVVVIIAQLISIFRNSDEDRKNYAVVAETFIRKSGFIANKLGKIEGVSHIGKGGGGGRVSYNVFRLRGEDATGVCNMTLNKDDESDWFVTNADLRIKGKEFVIPIKRSTGNKWKQFKLK